MTPTAVPLVVPDLLRERAAADPGFVALRVGAGAALTLGQWEARSNGAARGLVDRGVVPGAPLALLGDEEHWVDYAVAYLAVLKAGAVAVPIGRRSAAAEVERLVAQARPMGAVQVGGGAGPAIALEVVELGALGAGQSTETFQVAVGPDDLAEILSTSGTTGTPKAVACTHRSVLAHDLPPEGAPAVGQVVSFLHAFPVGTQAGQEALRVPLRIAGRTAIALPRFDPDALCALVARHRVARLQLVPATAQVLVASGATGRHDVSSVRRVILSSAHAPPALFGRLAAAFPAASLWNAYALTEAGSARTLTRWDVARPTSVGRPVGETEVRIVGDDGATVSAGGVGEVWLRRRGTPARAYHADPEATAAVFVDGWTRTGDLGHLDGDGHLHLDDRRKDIIISGGRNISSVEVEDALCEHPEVVEAAVFGVGHAVLGEGVAAAVVAGPSVGTRALQDHVRSRLAEHKVPRRIVLVDELPRNPSGKVQKEELRRRHGSEDAGGGGRAPEAGLEATVAAVWGEVLERRHVGADDDFFALGGHSLAAARIASRLSETLGVAVPAGALFEAPTVAELVRVVAPLVAGPPADDA